MIAPDILAAAGALDVLVIGEAMLDRYTEGSCGRLCREAPVPVVARTDRRDAPGGAANTAALCARLGARTRFLSLAGDDEPGRALTALLEAGGVDCAAMAVVPGRATLLKERFTGNGRLLLRVDSGSEAEADAANERRLLDALEALWRRTAAVIVSDYGYGVLSARAIGLIADLQARMPRVLIVDARDLTRWRSVGATLVKPNYDEALALLHEPPVASHRRVAQVTGHADALFAATGAGIVAATLDVSGAVVLQRGAPPHRTRTDPAPADHATGAGDAFAAGFALALGAGAGVADAADFAASVACACVHEPGTTLCAPEALLRRAKHVGVAEALARIAERRRAGARIVFTNGCFDILHSGHVSYLEEARALGDMLVVGLNGDAGVRALKGAGRPVNREQDRARVLAALASVDLIIGFDDPTPAALIEAIVPDVFAKGADYSRATLPEAALVERLGGEVRLIALVPDRSTTGIIARIASAPRALAS